MLNLNTEETENYSMFHFRRIGQGLSKVRRTPSQIVKQLMYLPHFLIVYDARKEKTERNPKTGAKCLSILKKLFKIPPKLLLS